MAIRCVVRALWWAACACAVAAQATVYDDPIIAKLLKGGMIPASFSSYSSIRVKLTNGTSREIRMNDLIDLQKHCSGLKHFNDTDLRIHLNYLSLDQTGMKHLDLCHLKPDKLLVNEDHLTELKGNLSSLRSLNLTAPALEVIDVSHLKINLLPPEFAKTLPKLKKLWLEQSIGQLTKDFLIGASNLTSFRMMQANLTSMPYGLFFHSPQLEFIDLRYNHIKTLPRKAFHDLPKLRILLLDYNELKQNTTYVIEILGHLRVLGLSGNPLGNLCAVGGVSIFSWIFNLKKLYLANIGATYLCMDWVIDMQWLAKLDYRNNLMKKLDCADLRMSRDDSIAKPVIDLRGNPIAVAECTKGQYEQAIPYGEIPTKPLKMLISSHISCSCGWTYMRRVLPLLHVDLLGPEGYEVCTDKDLKALEDRQHCP